MRILSHENKKNTQIKIIDGLWVRGLENRKFRTERNNTIRRKLMIYQPSPNKFMKCKYCGSRRVIKKGFRNNLTGKVREHLGMKRLSSRKLIVKIFLFLVLQSVLVVRR